MRKAKAMVIPPKTLDQEKLAQFTSPDLAERYAAPTRVSWERVHECAFELSMHPEPESRLISAIFSWGFNILHRQDRFQIIDRYEEIIDELEKAEKVKETINPVMPTKLQSPVTRERS